MVSLRIIDHRSFRTSFDEARVFQGRLHFRSKVVSHWLRLRPLVSGTWSPDPCVKLPKSIKCFRSHRVFAPVETMYIFFTDRFSPNPYENKAARPETVGFFFFFFFSKVSCISRWLRTWPWNNSELDFPFSFRVPWCKPARLHCEVW